MSRKLYKYNQYNKLTIFSFIKKKNDLVGKR